MSRAGPADITRVPESGVRCAGCIIERDLGTASGDQQKMAAAAKLAERTAKRVADANRQESERRLRARREAVAALRCQTEATAIPRLTRNQLGQAIHMQEM